MEPTLFDTFLTLGQQAFQRGDWEQAEEAFGAAVAASEDGESVSSQALALNNLAAVLHQRGRLDQAIEASERALSVYAGAQHSYPGEIGLGLVNLGQLYMEAGRWTQAEAALLSAAEKLAVEGDESARRTQKERLAQLYLQQEKLPQAAEAYSALLADLLAYQPEPSEEVARVSHFLSNMQEALGDIEGARASREGCLLRLRRLWLPDHPQALAEVLANMAESLATAGRPGQALPYLEEAAEWLTEPGDLLSHLQLLRLAMLRESDQPQRAIDAAPELLASGREPAFVAKMQAELGLCEFLLKRYQVAEQLFSQALESPLARQDYNFRISALYNLATAQQGREQEDPTASVSEAEATYSLALSLAQEYLPPGHGLTARLVWNYSGLLEKRGDLARAQALRQQFGTAL